MVTDVRKPSHHQKPERYIAVHFLEDRQQPSYLMWKPSIALLLLVAAACIDKSISASAFLTQTSSCCRTLTSSTPAMSMTTTSDESTKSSSTRRQLLFSSSRGVVVAAAAAAAVSSAWMLPLQPAVADVADGSALPQGAAQFSRILRLKVDLVSIEKRVASLKSGSDIDGKEWDSLGQFLRRIYAIGDDMKVVSGGIYDPDRKKQANEAISLLKRYAQAGDIAVNNKDPAGFVLVIQKLENQVNDFLDSLRDVPDEI